MKPTIEAYNELQAAYDHFNIALFDGSLPYCLITLQREKNTYGYFSEKRFVNMNGETTDEIAMNPAFFVSCRIEEIMQTLVHEMTHLWQSHFGQPGRRGYHNKEWAEKMESIGLMPSSTGRPGGAKTGEKMSDYPIDGGAFSRACQSLLTKNYRVSWADRFPDKKKLEIALQQGTITPAELKTWGVDVAVDGVTVVIPEKKPTRAKLTCPTCGANAWGKPSLNLVCGDCESAFVVTALL